MTGVAVNSLRPQLDFLQRIKESDADYHTAFLGDEDRYDLSGILQDAITYGGSTALHLERRVHAFLVRLQFLDTKTKFLDEAARKELTTLIQVDPFDAVPPRRQARRWTRTDHLRAALATVAVAALTGAVGVGISVYGRASHQPGPPAGIVSQNPPALVVQPGPTDLQALRQDFGPWQQLTPSDQTPQTGSPALLLLDGGNYLVSTRWTVPASSTSWQQDLGGSVGNIDVRGDHVDITDADGNPYIVGVGQAFIVSSDPQKVLKIDGAGAVYTMSLAEATAARQPIK